MVRREDGICQLCTARGVQRDAGSSRGCRNKTHVIRLRDCTAIEGVGVPGIVLCVDENGNIFASLEECGEGE